MKIYVFAAAIMGLGYAVSPDYAEATERVPKCAKPYGSKRFRADVSLAALNAMNLAIAHRNFRGVSARDRNRAWGTAGMLMGLTTWALFDNDIRIGSDVLWLGDSCNVPLGAGLFISGSVSFFFGLLRIFVADKPDHDRKLTRQWRTSPIVLLSRANKYLGVALVVEL